MSDPPLPPGQHLRTDFPRFGLLRFARRMPAEPAALRLLAPAHYGYKSIKHLERMEFCQDLAGYRPSAWRFMDHARARVALQERGRWLPGWLLRWLCRPLIGFTVRRFAALAAAARQQARR